MIHELLLQPGYSWPGATEASVSSCCPCEVLWHLYEAILDVEDHHQHIVSDTLRKFCAGFWKLSMAVAIQDRLDAASNGHPIPAAESDVSHGGTSANQSCVELADIKEAATRVEANDDDRVGRPFDKCAAVARVKPLWQQEVNYIICCPAALWERRWLPRSHAASIASRWQVALDQPGMLASVGRTLDQLMDELNIKISPHFPWVMQPASQCPVNDSSRLGPMRMDLELKKFPARTKPPGQALAGPQAPDGFFAFTGWRSTWTMPVSCLFNVCVHVCSLAVVLERCMQQHCTCLCVRWSHRETVPAVVRWQDRAYHVEICCQPARAQLALATQHAMSVCKGLLACTATIQWCLQRSPAVCIQKI